MQRYQLWVQVVKVSPPLGLTYTEWVMVGFYNSRELAVAGFDEFKLHNRVETQYVVPVVTHMK